MVIYPFWQANEAPSCSTASIERFKERQSIKEDKGAKKKGRTREEACITIKIIHFFL